MKLNLWRWSLALIAVLALVAAGCGDDKKDSGGGGSTGGGGGTADAKVIKKNPANASKTVTIGSKNFPEQFILGNIYAQALEAAGYKVKTQLNLGDEGIAYKSLRGGTIDAYPEYIGTSLSSHLKVKVLSIPKEPKQAFAQLVQMQAKNGVTPLPYTPFENTYRLGMTKAAYDKLGIKTTSELKGKEGGMAITGFPECEQRPDCLIGVQNTYGLKFKKFVAAPGAYPLLDKGKADIGFVFTTDAELTTNKYAVLEDDKHLFPPYQITLLFKTDKLQQLGPDAQKAIVNVQTGLTEDVMRELNSRVVLDKQKPDKVAADYLRESGYVK
jgi:glycine betaine/choline ABC-type transport system substrate-binding protein